jgi:Ca2+-transporting ATPase
VGELTAPMKSTTPTPWAIETESVLDALNVDPAQGLDEPEAVRRLRLHGKNEFAQAARRGLWRILLDQFSSVITALLCVAAVIALLFGDTAEAVAIGVVVIVNSTIGFAIELHALRSMQALRELGQVPATVRRDGKLRRIDARDLVPGDILVLEGGDIVSADARLIDSSRLQANESLLTGESEPVDKSPEVIPKPSNLVERSNMLFKGSALTRGHAEAVVVATGAATQVGAISDLTSSASPGATPLEKNLQRLGHRLVGLTVIVCALMVIVGLATGQDLLLSVETAIALAVAAIPEGLPIVATIALARGMRRMARNNALIERLSAVETLGATSLIVTDKTGTLTANRMSVRRLIIPETEIHVNHSAPGPGFEKLLQVAALCNTAELSSSEKGIGDPTEIALLAAAGQAGIDVTALRLKFPCHTNIAFDSEVKMMATVHPRNGRLLYCVKGAPEHIINACSTVWESDNQAPLTQQDRARWLDRANTLGDEGLRTLAFAFKEEDRADVHPYHELTFLGMAGIADPPHAGISEDMRACHDAGIRVTMVTGDQLATARAIAREINLCPVGHECQALDASDIQETENNELALASADVIARANPKLKLGLIAMHQARGEVVAMTGDGVNDAPALKKADIGVAMGERGTQVAREAAAMVLEDDEFSTIIGAVAQGRVIYTNIRKFVVYLLSCNLSEILVIGVATLIGAAPPLLPLQILFLNLVTDVFPALALGACGAEKGIMKQAPRPRSEPLIGRQQWARIASHALVITLSVVGGVEVAAHLPGLEKNPPLTLAFLILAFSQLWHVFNMRADHSRSINNEITRNPWVWAAVVVCIAILGLALGFGPLRDVLVLTMPDSQGWLLILCASLVPLLFGPLIKRILPTGNNSVRK